MSGPSMFYGRAKGAGVIRAKRAWGLDIDGTLRGYYYHYPWLPDVWNVAACEGSHKGIAHDIDTEEFYCGCGFYGYFNGSNDYHDKHGLPISGMIECTGVTLVGSVGIRTSRAKIVALAVPDVPIVPDAQFDRMLEHAYEQDISYMSHGDRRELGHFSFGDYNAKLTVVRQSAFDAFRAKYATVPLFSSVERMTAEFPEDAGDIVEFPTEPKLEPKPEPEPE